MIREEIFEKKNNKWYLSSVISAIPNNFDTYNFIANARFKKIIDYTVFKNAGITRKVDIRKDSKRTTTFYYKTLKVVYTEDILK